MYRIVSYRILFEMRSRNSFLESGAAPAAYASSLLEAGARACQSFRVADQSRASASTRRSYISNIAAAGFTSQMRSVDVRLGAIMACSSVGSLNSISAAGRRYETGSGIPPGGYSESSSPDGIQAELETTYAVPGKDLRHARIPESRAGTEPTPASTAYAGCRPYASLPGSWYPPTTDYYAVSATGYPVQAGSRLQTTCSAVTWPKMSTDDVKLTSFVLSLPPIECSANCRQDYCKEQ